MLTNKNEDAVIPTSSNSLSGDLIRKHDELENSLFRFIQKEIVNPFTQRAGWPKHVSVKSLEVMAIADSEDEKWYAYPDTPLTIEGAFNTVMLAQKSASLIRMISVCIVDEVTHGGFVVVGGIVVVVVVVIVVVVVFFVVDVLDEVGVNSKKITQFHLTVNMKISRILTWVGKLF